MLRDLGSIDVSHNGHSGVTKLYVPRKTDGKPSAPPQIQAVKLEEKKTLSHEDILLIASFPEAHAASQGAPYVLRGNDDGKGRTDSAIQKHRIPRKPFKDKRDKLNGQSTDDVAMKVASFKYMCKVSPFVRTQKPDYVKIAAAHVNSAPTNGYLPGA
ncbi:MAG: hypothetical protein M1822_000549 [Bathelium mastoideum]|nr:MAG: hypothetical protein M1822_000549 [Bathelium mastoideum]